MATTSAASDKGVRPLTEVAPQRPGPGLVPAEVALRWARPAWWRWHALPTLEVRPEARRESYAEPLFIDADDSLMWASNILARWGGPYVEAVLLSGAAALAWTLGTWPALEKSNKMGARAQVWAQGARGLAALPPSGPLRAAWVLQRREVGRCRAEQGLNLVMAGGTFGMGLGALCRISLLWPLWPAAASLATPLLSVAIPMVATAAFATMVLALQMAGRAARRISPRAGQSRALARALHARRNGQVGLGLGLALSAAGLAVGAPTTLWGHELLGLALLTPGVLGMAWLGTLQQRNINWGPKPLSASAAEHLLAGDGRRLVADIAAREAQMDALGTEAADGEAAVQAQLEAMGRGPVAHAAAAWRALCELGHGADLAGHLLCYPVWQDRLGTRLRGAADRELVLRAADLAALDRPPRGDGRALQAFWRSARATLAGAVRERLAYEQRERLDLWELAFG